jgi:hypothetical protein
MEGKELKVFQILNPVSKPGISTKGSYPRWECLALKLCTGFCFFKEEWKSVFQSGACTRIFTVRSSHFAEIIGLDMHLLQISKLYYIMLCLLYYTW